VGLLKTERRLARLGGRELEGPTRNAADPESPHELEAGEPFQVLGVPFPQLRVLGLLADDWILDDRVAEVIHHRSDCERHPTDCTGFSRAWLAWPVRTRYPRQPIRPPMPRSALALQPRFVGSRNRPCHGHLSSGETAC
jgi:hypothetical protein